MRNVEHVHQDIYVYPLVSRLNHSILTHAPPPTFARPDPCHCQASFFWSTGLNDAMHFAWPARFRMI